MHCKRLVLSLVAVLAAAGLAAAPSGSTAKGAGGSAIGLFLGQPTGITFRQGLGGEQSFEAKAAWDFGSSQSAASITLQANWLLEFPGIIVIEKEDFPLYVGAGAQASFGQDLSLGIRVPAGIVYRFKKAPIELCLELGFGLQLFPSTLPFGSGGLGARYRF